MSQKNVVLILILIVALAGVVAWWVFIKQPQSPVTINIPPSSSVKTIEYSFPYNKVVIRVDGLIAIEIPRDDVNTFNYQCTVTDPQPSQELRKLFILASKSNILNANEAYLPTKGSFAYHGHDTRISIVLKNADETTVKNIVYSDQPEKTPPPEVTKLGKDTYSYVWEHLRTFIEKTCGPIPHTIRGID